MNPRHAAALALVGWYLMTMPLNNSLPASINYNAPLSEWDIMRSYDTAADCEASKLDWIKRNAKMKEINRELAGMSKCVATDDPRLKEK